jgi:lysyl-tRNA synthetase class I
MSTSKGRGAAAHTIAEVVPPEQLRFLFLRYRPNHAIDFDPEGTDQVPRLFDDFDKFAAATAGREVRGELAPGYEATFGYSLLDPDANRDAEAAAYRAPFAHLAMLIQVPGVDVVERVESVPLPRGPGSIPTRPSRRCSRSSTTRYRRRSPSSTPRSSGSSPDCPSGPPARSRPAAMPGRR